ncbi:MAG: tRNA-dihydrouridine synthase [Deltaproteobacteria bacterium]|nr:MAG: tRNA-dihydrouridine synthase [Deltaproteobacteria bacterium]
MQGQSENPSFFRRGALFLAPLAGYTDMPFRITMRELGADVVVTEMVNAFGLTLERERKKTSKYVQFDPAERPIGAQIFGAIPEKMAEGAKICQELGFDFVDVNMGCPVRKVVRTGAGAALMKNPSLASSIVSHIKKTVSIPVTAKIRTGWTRGDRGYLDLVERLVESGVDALFVHGRPVSQGMTGPVDLEGIRLIRKRFPHLFLVANGGVESPEDYRKTVEETGCDAVMIGRGALKDPFIFRKIKGLPESKNSGIGEIVLRHFRRHLDFYGERGTVLFRKFLPWYTKGLPGSSAFRRKVNEITDPAELESEIRQFYRLIPVNN